MSPETTTTESTPRRTGRNLACCSAVVLACGLLASSFVFVDETELVLVERLGQITAIYDRPSDRGLQFKLPWPVETVRRFDARVQLLDPPAGEMVTRDKKNITVDAYFCWKIADPGATSGTGLSDRPVFRFFTALGNSGIARVRLSERVIPQLRTRIGETDFGRLVEVQDSQSGPETAGSGLLVSIPRDVRNELGAPIRDLYGIELVDVRIKRLNFPRQNQLSVFERMKTERKKIAEQYRSDGLAENTKIKSRADLQYNEIIANAQREAEVIRGQADADALTILNQAHSQDPEFYRFTRTLESYRRILNERTTLVLSASNSLLKLLTEGIPGDRNGATRSSSSPTATPSKSASGGGESGP